MAHVDKLFKAFHRLHTTEQFAGTGIGLATVQRIVTRHGGRVWAEAAPGQGATFRFTLGANAAETASGASTAPPVNP
jgi:light-regulated signal transduction histidine kinase (bacteriophytochrome)